jgi:hypothetical protein
MNPSTTRARELTDWYPADAFPVHPGVYELLNSSTGVAFYSRWIIRNFAYWKISGWSRGHSTVDDAEADHKFGVVQEKWQWRGLKEQAC